MLRHMGERGGPLGGVAARNPLGISGGSGGVKHHRNIAGVGARFAIEIIVFQ